MAEDDINTEGLFNSKEGPLAKTGSNNKGWKDRYFRLKDGKLNYYKSEKDSVPLGFVDLRECTKVIQAPGKKGGYGFDVHVPGRVYNMSARLEDERDDWIGVIDVSVAIAKSVYGDEFSERRRGGSVLSRGRNRRSTSISSLEPEESTLDNLSNRRSEPDFNSLLEAQVTALNSKSSQLEEEVQTAVSQRDSLQDKLQEMKTDHEEAVKQLREEVSLLKNQIDSLERAKSSLEAVNDSLRVQVQEKDESMMNLEQQMTEEIRELEDETRVLQEDLEKLKEKQLEVNDQNEQLSQSNSDLQSKLKTMAIDSDKDRKELNQENTVLSQKVKELTNEVELERDKHSQERNQRMKAEEHLKQSTELYHKLEVTERERDRLKVLLASLQQNQHTDSSSTVEELKSERLQLQLELENLRTTMNNEMEAVKGDSEREKEELLRRIMVLEEEQSHLTQFVENKESDLNTTVIELKEKVAIMEDSNHLLQIEKEKVLADLIAMKKNMKEKERRYNSDEETTSPVANGGTVTSRDAQLLEAENRAEMATRLLKEIQAERDFLKAQIKKQGSPSKQSSSNEPSPIHVAVPSTDPHNHLAGGGNTRVTSNFKTKTQPTLALSNTRDIPPPKPKPPSKDILDRLFL